ncbi:Pkinase-domain-containing protein [Xylariomycetidae sp. FL2044]|nr:Pkinase-domain-containing protein [Xylariomycetidae sp. FL2044]
MGDVDKNPVIRTRTQLPSSSTPNQSSEPSTHSRDVVMERDRTRDQGARPRDQSRSDRGPRGYALDRPSSPSSSSLPRHAQSRRDRDDRGRGGRREERLFDNSRDPKHDASRRGRSPDRSRDYHEGSREMKDYRDDNFDQAKWQGIPTSPRHGPRFHDQAAPRHPRERSFSPSSRKRRRSRSPLPFPPPRPKKSKRDRERDRRRRAERAERIERERAHDKAAISSRDRRLSPPRRRTPSPGHDGSRSSLPDYDDTEDPSRHHRRSRSPGIGGDPEPSNPPTSHPHRDQKHADRSRSPRPGSRRSSFSRNHSPHRPNHRPHHGSPGAGSYSRRSSPSFEPSGTGLPPRSPRDRASRKARKKAKNRDDARFPPRGPKASGANSIEVNTSRRDRRSSFGMQVPPSHSKLSQHNDVRHSQSSPHATSASSLHGSRASQSPHNSRRASLDGRPRYSPHSPFPHKHDAPNGPSNKRASDQSPPHPPTGPSQPHAHGRGFSRSGFRGSLSSAPGPRYSHPTASSNNAQSAGADSGDQNRGHPGQSDEDTPQRLSPSHATAIPSETIVDHDPGQDDCTSGLLDDSTSEKKADERMPPPGPPPTAPTGPASSTTPRFSFAFKGTSKTPVATPKPEISQKFSSAPKKETLPLDDRDRDRDRELPRDTPREPASARSRPDHRSSRPSDKPRTRMVKRIEKKLKPKPQLPSDLATSDSVYFRKPGNESVIGSGTYGKVFKGLHVYNKKLVALKKIRMEGERDGFPVTAVREIKLLQSLRHTNIVKLEEVMVEKNECYMVFEYLSHDLTGLLNHPSFKLDAAQRKDLCKQLFESLDYLHKRGVLHRDIKAANILVSNEGILKLADFGLARFYAKHRQIDYTNRVITIWYRSPELLLGETKYGDAADIWSAACVMVEIFTRHAIFPGDGTELNQLDKIYNILGTPNKNDWPGLVDMPWFELMRPGYRRPSTFVEKYRDRLPAAGFDVLQEMFQYDPAKRPSAAQVLEHPYFTTEYPPPKQATELKDVEGDWHEFESKALRREKEKREREARRSSNMKEAGESKDRDRKRPPPSASTEREPKRPHVDERPAPPSRTVSSNVQMTNGPETTQ